MSCNDPTQSTFSMWWSNGSYNNISSSCQEFIIPVDGIRKENPAGQTTATIGVPFTYTLTFPDMATLTSSGYVYSGTAGHRRRLQHPYSPTISPPRAPTSPT